MPDSTVPTPALYRHRPTLALAMPFTVDNRDAVPAWLRDSRVTFWAGPDGALRIPTPHGPAALLLGDWVVREVDDQFRPIRRGTFARSYEEYEPYEDIGNGGTLDPMAHLDAVAAERDAVDAAWRAAIRVAALAGVQPAAIARAARVTAAAVRTILGPQG